MNTEPAIVRLTFSVRKDLEEAIELAAELTGQTVSEFAISALAQSAHKLIQEQNRTVLSKRDRDIFMRLLDRTDASPNRALVAAARRYTRLMRKGTPA